MQLKIAFVTTCRGRLDHLRVTLPRNIAWNPGALFVVLDYNDQDGLEDYILTCHEADLDAGRLVYYKNKDAPRFHMGHAKNQAHRCAMREGADILVTLDADNLTSPGFYDYIKHRFWTSGDLSFLCPDFKALPPKGFRFNKDQPTSLGRGFAGRLAIRSQDFVKVGGYNETFDTWRGEDMDIIERLKRLQLRHGPIDRHFLHAIPHSSHVRFKEYPEAAKFENDDIYAVIANSQDTVVNDGNIGCGRVFCSFSNEPIELKPLPTRVFGIGMQRTGTTSLAAAFEELGYDTGHWKSATWAQNIWWEMNRWGRSRTLEKDYALTDNPIPVLYKQLDKAYPGSKFVLTIREEEAWLDSCERFWTYEGNPRRWTWDTDGFSHKMHSIIYGTPKFDREIFRARYRQHNAEVMAYFQGRNDFLAIDLKNALMETLNYFLGVPVKGYSRAFPHKNGATNV